MELSKGKFEPMSHTVYGGAKMDVPVLVARPEGLTPESAALLQIVSILGGRLEDYDNDINALIERVAYRLEDPENAGLIVEDKEGAGTVTIGREVTQVAVREVGKSEVPTKLVFEMLNRWSQLQDEASSRPVNT